MPFTELLHVANIIIDSIGPDELTDDSLMSLHAIFPENLLLSALDLVDRSNIIKYAAPWGYTEYEVLGSSDTYTVMLDLFLAEIPFYCSCPSFAIAVLKEKTHVMCKHILAARLACRLSRCIERTVGPVELEALFKRQFSMEDLMTSESMATT
ncbi:hypothetical protein BDQ12DRAFT_730330 [Crucibulum laeve]|uniref:SWIM-type domain-containing protein n=1 Tax=Crucibulum laeve TaxID=68775 RepID=A0A5C3MSD3_9AGAR|nr:hypothetical protein BDQ12DRAFT_730330 [Crucibulum laeve]